MTDTSKYGATLLRLLLGATFLAHAYLKVFIFTLPGTVAFFGKLGLPGWLAYVTIAAEILGGLALIAGFYTRYVAILLIPILLGAIVTVHGPIGFWFNAPGGGWEFIGFWIVALVVQALIGDGAGAVKPSVATPAA